jgi:hypothetical protein
MPGIIKVRGSTGEEDDVPERIEAAIQLRVNAQRLRQIASVETRLSFELIQIAEGLENEARRLEAAVIRDSPKPTG